MPKATWWPFSMNDKLSIALSSVKPIYHWWRRLPHHLDPRCANTRHILRTNSGSYPLIVLGSQLHRCHAHYTFTSLSSSDTIRYIYQRFGQCEYFSSMMLRPSFLWPLWFPCAQKTQNSLESPSMSSGFTRSPCFIITYSPISIFRDASHPNNSLFPPMAVEMQGIPKLIASNNAFDKPSALEEAL